MTNADNTKMLNHVSLCYGYGGIDLGFERVFGGSIRTILVSEIETYAIENALAKMEQGRISPCPIWTDLRTIPWDLLAGRVDILSGGFPCQPFSQAGKQAGDEDERHLFPFILEGVKQSSPRAVFLENVEGILSAKLSGDGWRDPAGTPVLLHVLRELERVGYKCTAGMFTAGEAGAPHERKRVFILAVLDHSELKRLEGYVRPDGDEEGREDEDRSASEAVVRHWRRVVFADECEQCDCCDEVICPNCQTHYWECGCPGPTQDEIEYVEDRTGTLWGRSYTKWPSYPGEEPKPNEPPALLTEGQYELGGDVDGLAHRVDRTRLLGNGVLPHVAEIAFQTLIKNL